MTPVIIERVERNPWMCCAVIGDRHIADAGEENGDLWVQFMGEVVSIGEAEQTLKAMREAWRKERR